MKFPKSPPKDSAISATLFKSTGQNTVETARLASPNMITTVFGSEDV